jgi:hypothetical protein
VGAAAAAAGGAAAEKEAAEEEEAEEAEEEALAAAELEEEHAVQEEVRVEMVEDTAELELRPRRARRAPGRYADAASDEQQEEAAAPSEYVRRFRLNILQEEEVEAEKEEDEEGKKEQEEEEEEEGHDAKISGDTARRTADPVTHQGDKYTSQFVGVSWFKRLGKWKATCQRQHLGRDCWIVLATSLNALSALLS